MAATGRRLSLSLAPRAEARSEGTLSPDETAALSWLEDLPDPMPEMGRKQIVRALTSRDPSLRKLARDYLLEWDEEPCLNIPHLEGLLDSDLDDFSRTNVLEVLWKISPLDVLAGTFFWDKANKAHAVQYLSGSVTTPPDQVIDLYLGDSDPRNRVAAITARGMLTGLVEEAVSSLLQECAKEDRSLDYEDIEKYLIRMLPGQATEVESLYAGLESDVLDFLHGPRKVASRISAISTDVTALRPLMLHLISTAITEVRIACLMLLARFGEYSIGMPAVASLLESPDPLVCYSATTCLAKIVGTRALGPLIDFVTGCTWPKVREHALETIFTLDPTIKQLEILGHRVDANVLVDELSSHSVFDAVDRFQYSDMIFGLGAFGYRYGPNGAFIDLVSWMLEMISSTSPSEAACRVIRRLLSMGEILQLGAGQIAIKRPIVFRPALPEFIDKLRLPNEDIAALSAAVIKAIYLAFPPPDRGQVPALPLVLEAKGEPDKFLSLLATNGELVLKLKGIAGHSGLTEDRDVLIHSFFTDFTAKQLRKGQLLGFDVAQYAALDPWIAQAFRNWLDDRRKERAIATERVISQRQSEIFFDSCETKQEDPQDAAIRNEVFEAVHHGLNRLSRPIDREVILRRFFAGQPFHEIWKEMNMTKSAVEVSLRRAERTKAIPTIVVSVTEQSSMRDIRKIGLGCRRPSAGGRRLL